MQNSLKDELLDCVAGGVIVAELENSADDRSLRLVFANRAASLLTGIDLACRVGEPLSLIFPAANAGRTATYAEVCRTRQRRDIGRVSGLGAASLSTFSVAAVPVLERAVAIVFENLSEQQRAESEARALSRFLDSIIEHIPAMVFMKDAERLCFERFNKAGEQLLGLGRAQLLGKSDHEFFPAEQADAFVSKDREVLAGRRVVDIPEEPIQTPHGTRWLHTRKIPLLDEAGDPLYLLGVSIDISEQKRARDALQRALESTEEQLRQAQKMDAVGRLAGGIAHDFNNLLSVILSYTTLALGDLQQSERLHGDLSEVKRAAERASVLTRQLLAFSRQQMLAPRVVDLGGVISNLDSMLRRLIGEHIELSTLVAPGLYKVKVDPGQIEQVVLNLVVNARDAMPNGGKLRIEVQNLDLDAVGAVEHPGVVAGRHVLLTVSDNGQGMTPEVQARLYEPFFTTKETGKGTGLGLAMVFGIVKQSGGSIAHTSEPGRGTAFRLYFPASNEREKVPDSSGTRARSTGTEGILLVEDEEQVRRVVSGLLRRGGYSVLEARTPAEALSLAQDPTRKFDLLLTDVVMPQMSGPELARRMRSERPALRVLCMSGYTDESMLRHSIIDAALPFLQKPITPASLLEKVREVLGAELPGAARREAEQ